MYISFTSEYWPNIKHIVKAATWLNEIDIVNRDEIISQGYGFIMFENVDEMDRIYNLTVGDDGPTKTNSYCGPVKIYALTCSPKGILISENT